MIENLNNTTTSLSFLIAEDHKLLRKICKQILIDAYPTAAFEETDNIAEIIETLEKRKVDVLVLDVHLTDGNTLTILHLIKAKYPDTRVLFFTMCPEDIYGKRILNNGADGFLSKRADESELREAIETIISGEKYISRKLQRQMADEVITKKMSNPFDRLSDREFEVMILLLQGKSLTDIGADLALQVSTVSTHKTRLFDKLNVTTLMELSKIAAAYEITS